MSQPHSCIAYIEQGRCSRFSMMLHRAPLLEETFFFWRGTIVTAVGSKPWTLATWSSFAAQPDRSPHGSGMSGHWYKEGVIGADLNCFASLLRWISSVSGPHWCHALSVTNPFTLIKGTLFVKCHWLRKEPARVCSCIFVPFMKRIWLSQRELLQHQTCESVPVSHKFLNLHGAQSTSQCVHDRSWYTWLTNFSMWML